MKTKVVVTCLLCFATGMLADHFLYPRESQISSIAIQETQKRIQHQRSPAAAAVSTLPTPKATRDFSANFARWRQSPGHTEYSLRFNQLFTDWGRKDHVAALVAANSLKGPQRNLAVAKVLHGWAEADASAAWNYFAANLQAFPNPKRVEGELTGEFARQNGLKVFAAIQNLPGSWDHREPYVEAVKQLASQGLGTGAAREIEKIGNAANRKAALTGLAYAIGQLGQGQAAVWYNQLDDSEKSSSLARSVVAGLAFADPEAAANFALSLDGKPGNEALQDAVSAWARSGGAAAASQWLENTVPSDKRDAALYGFVPSLAATDPDLALQLANLVSDPTVRRRTTTAALKQWTRSDPAAATDWIKTQTANPGYVEEITAIAQARFEHSPVAAVNLVNTIPDSNRRSSELRNIATIWAMRDQSAAEKYFSSTTGLSPADRKAILSTIQNLHHQ